MMRHSDHAFHNKSFQFTLPGSSGQCFLCVNDILGDTSISGVQRHRALRHMKMVLESPRHIWPQKWIEFLDSTELICHMIDLAIDVYCCDPFTDLAVSMVTSFIMQTKGENILKHFIDKCFKIVHGKIQKDSIHFCLLVVDNVCKLDGNKTRFLMFHGEQVMLELKNLMMVTDGLMNKSRIMFLFLLKHVMGVFCEEEETKWPIRVKEFALITINALIIWLNDPKSGKDFHQVCLQLLQVVLQYRPFHKMFTSTGLTQTEAANTPTLLKGLKKILCLKEDELTILAIQCLFDLVAGIKYVEQYDDIMKIGLPECVFESLHTKNALLLNSVFKCLQSMAAHKVFYEKGHGVSGMDSCLAALQNTLDSNNLESAEEGLCLLNLILHNQPENMPLFVCQSWHQCTQIIERALARKHSNNLVSLAFSCTASFFRPHHQIRPRNVKRLESLILTVAETTQYLQFTGSRKTKIMNTVMELFITANSLISSGGEDLCGNTAADIQHFRETLMGLTCKLILPWVKEYRSCLEDQNTIKMYLLVMRNLMEVATVDSVKSVESGHFRESAVSECGDMIACGMVSLVMERYSLFHLNDPMRQLAGHVIAQIFLTISQTKPQFTGTHNLQMLSSGLSRLNWNPKDPSILVRSLSNKEDTTAVLTALHISYDQGYRAIGHTGIIDVLYKVVSVLEEDIIANLETNAIKSFVYLHCLSWQMLKDFELSLMEALDAWLLHHLAINTVEKWFIKDHRLFLWCFSSERKSAKLGNQLLDHWLEEMVLNSGNPGGQQLHLDKDNRMILNELKKNFEFCKTMTKFCLSQQMENRIAKMSSQILVSWTQLISSQEMSEDTSILHHKMLTYMCQLFEEATSINKNGKVIEEYLLPVLCELLSCPLNKNIDNPWRFRPKTILFVSKLLCANEIESSWEKCLQFLSYVCATLPSQDSRAMMTPMLFIEGFPQRLRKVFESKLNRIYSLGLPIIDWLIQNGKNYEGKEVVQISVEYLLWRLGVWSSDKDSLLQLLTLVQVAISSSLNNVCVRGPIRFVKETLYCLLSGNVLDLRDFRQMYIHMQQFLISDYPDVRLKAVDCVEQMMAISRDVCEHIKHQPWNGFLVHSMLQVRVRDGLQEADINFCHLLVMKNMEQFWTEMSATNFLKSVLNSNLKDNNEGMRSKIKWLVEQLKMSSVYVHEDLLNAVEKCFNGNSPELLNR